MQDKIERLIQRINDNPDRLHSDYTPAVSRLIEVGEPALDATLTLMLSENPTTRLRAQRVIEGVTMKLYGFRPGHGWSNSHSEEEWYRLWNALGDLNWDASSASREKAVGLWRQWMAQRTPEGPNNSSNG